MRPKHLVAAFMVALLSVPVSAQSVKAGIEAWHRADYAAAVAIWRPLADAGDADAQFNLGQAYRLGRGVPINLALAKSWFEHAAAGGHLDAQTTLGLLLFQNGDQENGLRWLKAAADKGEPRALLVYGTALVNGDGVTQDPVLGYAYVSRAAAQGLAPAKETLKELDKLLSLADRKKGVAIARAAAKSARPPKSKPERLPSRPIQAVAAKPPTKTEAPTQQITVSGGGWMIQLGAFSQRASAEALYRRLLGSGALAGMQPVYRSVGSITRLQVGSFQTRAAAAAACKALVARGQPCFPVAAK
jgi:hypothetical protein